MQEHIQELLSDKLLDDKRFCEAFCDGCKAITHDSGDFDNPPSDDCPAVFSIGGHDCVRHDDWKYLEAVLAFAAHAAANCTVKEEYLCHL